VASGNYSQQNCDASEDNVPGVVSQIPKIRHLNNPGSLFEL